MSEHVSTLFLITHGARTIDRIAVYDIATTFIIYVLVNSGVVFGNFTYDSPKIGNLVFSCDLFCLRSTKQYGKICLPYRYRFSIVLKYFYSWFSSTTYWCSFWSISTTHRWLRQLFRYVCLSCAGHLAHSRNQSCQFRERLLRCFW